jgi:hypothetical protein
LGKIPSIKVPQMGLADGIIRMLYETHVKARHALPASEK